MAKREKTKYGEPMRTYNNEKYRKYHNFHYLKDAKSKANLFKNDGYRFRITKNKFDNYDLWISIKKHQSIRTKKAMKLQFEIDELEDIKRSAWLILRDYKSVSKERAREVSYKYNNTDRKILKLQKEMDLLLK